MKNKERNKSFYRQLFTIALIFYVLLSSCSTKRGIKSLLNIPINTTKTVQLANSGEIASLKKDCLSCKDLHVTVADIDYSIQKNLNSVAIFVTVYQLFLHTIDVKETNIPIPPSPKLHNAIPKYLLFQKLILHNA